MEQPPLARLGWEAMGISCVVCRYTNVVSCEEWVYSREDLFSSTGLLISVLVVRVPVTMVLRSEELVCGVDRVTYL